MTKELEVVNVDYLPNAYAQEIIQERTNNGWGIDAMVTDVNKNTWITFYRYVQSDEEKRYDSLGQEGYR